jgi:protein-S-isoprenylcysteine O-methyltransferase Ste14
MGNPVAGKLNALRTAKLTGDIPQNVDFAIKGAVARSFLDIHGVDYRRRLSDETLAPEAVAALDKARVTIPRTGVSHWGREANTRRSGQGNDTTHWRMGTAVRIPPPVVYLGAVIVGVLVHGFVAPLPIALPIVLRIAAGTAAAVASLVIVGFAIKLFRRTGQDPKPWATTPEIVSTGVYRITRDPMYVGMALLQIAIGIGLADWWIIIAVPVPVPVPVLVVLVVVCLTAIRHEESYLDR